MNTSSAEQRENLSNLLAIGERIEKGELQLDWVHEALGEDCGAPRCLVGWYDHFYNTDFIWRFSPEMMAGAATHFGISRLAAHYLFGPNRENRGDDEAELRARLGCIRDLLSSKHGETE